MEFTIYHNPRCRKSREALQYLEKKGSQYQIVKYLENQFDKKTLGDVLKKISLNPSEIVRKNESIWEKKILLSKLNRRSDFGATDQTSQID